MKGRERLLHMEQKIGVVTHCYTKINVAIVKLEHQVQQGDTLHFVGHGSDFSQPADSLQYDHQTIPKARGGQEVGIKISGGKVHEGTEVFVVKP